MSRLTCTDCIHDYVCHNLNNLNYWNKDDPNGDPMDKFCLCFKNKELFIELPCKVGTDIYCILARYNFKRRESEYYIEIFPFEADMLNGLGEKFFLTKAEAIAKLAELKGGGGDEM